MDNTLGINRYSKRPLVEGNEKSGSRCDGAMAVLWHTLKFFSKGKKLK